MISMGLAAVPLDTLRSGKDVVASHQGKRLDGSVIRSSSRCTIFKYPEAR